MEQPPGVPSGQRGPLAQHGWWVLLAVGLPLAVATVLLAPLPALSLRIALVAAGVAGVVVGLHIHRPARPRPWWFVVVALSSSLAGDVIVIVTMTRGALAGTLAVDAWLTAVAGILLVVAVLDATGSTRRSELGGLLDAIVVALAAGTLIWSLLIVPAAAPGWVGSSVEIAGSIQILVFAALVALVGRSFGRLRQRTRTAVGLAITALVCATTAFLLGALVDAGPVVPYTGARAFFGAAANLLMGAAALHPTMRSFTDRLHSRAEPLDTARTLRLGVALATPAAVLLVTLITDAPTPYVVLVIGWVLLVPAVLTRLHLLAHDHAVAQRRTDATERRLAALVAHTGDVLLLARRTGTGGHADATIEYASPAARTLLGRAPDALLGTALTDLIVPDDRPAVAELLTEAGQHPTTTDARAVDAAGDGTRWVQVIGDRYTGDDEPDALVITLRDVTARKTEEQRWVEAAMRDHGTGLLNRRAIEKHITATLAVGRPGAGASGVLMCDLDDFKEANDRYGHAIGDAVLREVADRLRGAVRRHDVVGRIGGDEFLVICPIEDGVAGLGPLAERIVRDISRPYEVAGATVQIGCSVGVAAGDGVDRTAAQLLQEADLALYRAKDAGKGRVAWAPGLQPAETP